jgi:hypothetical protein
MSRQGNLKRHLLPNFKKINLEFNVDKLKQALQSSPQKFDDLLSGYKDISEAFPHDEESFGLAFPTAEEARQYCKEMGRPIAVYSDNGRWRIGKESLLYFQMAITEYDGVGDPKLETSYAKLVSWAKGTYFEKVIDSFKGGVTRVRVARMLPGCHVKKHIDYNTDFSVRYHVAINSEDGNWLEVHRRGESERLHIPEDGSCWFVNQGWPHEAKNEGPQIRDHLVLSVKNQYDLFE